MKVGVDFSVTGYNELTNRVADMGRKQASMDNAALKEGAKPVLEAILRKAPVRTGRGKSAIKIGRIRTMKGVKTISIGVHKEDHDKGLHMYYQEFGTSRHAARPHIRPGFEEEVDNAYRIIRDATREALGL